MIMRGNHIVPIYEYQLLPKNILFFGHANLGKVVNSEGVYTLGWVSHRFWAEIDEQAGQRLQKRKEEEARKEAQEARIKYECLKEARQEIQEVHNRLTAKKASYDEYVKECDKLRRKYPSVGFNIHCSNFSGWGFNSSSYRIEIISYRGKSIY